MINKKRFISKPMNVVLGVIVSSLVTYNVQASDVWQNDLKSNAVSGTTQQKDSNLQVNRLQQQDAVHKLAQREVTSLSWQSDKQKGLSDMAISFTQDEYSAVMGYRQNGLTLSAMTGSGKEYGRLTGDYSGIDPYMFHGGNSLGFNYYGAAVDLDMSSFGHLQFGFADVKSDLLEDRSAQYMEWSNGSYYIRGNHFQRGNHDLGYGLDTGFYLGNVQVAYQGMELENQKSMHRVRFHYQKDDFRQYWFDIASHKNALYEENDDYRIMFSMRQIFGKKKFTPSYVSEDSEDSPEKEEKKRGLTRPILIGVGVAAIAAASSSGSDSQDSAPRVNQQHEAARVRLNQINPVSVRENREYGGYVYRNQDGSFSTIEPVRGELASVTLPDPVLGVPVGTVTTASYHTHGAFDPRFDNENFSPTDISSDAALGIDGYLGTPGGQFKYHDVDTGMITTLGTINN